MLHRIGGAVGTPDRPLTLVFDGEAVKGFERFLAWLQEEIRGTEGAEAGWLGKGRGTVVRLAAILALLDWSRHAPTARPPGTVRADHLQAATRLWRDYFRPHGRAVLDRCAPSDFERQARRVVRWLKKAGAKAETTREEVRRHAWARPRMQARPTWCWGDCGVPASCVPLPMTSCRKAGVRRNAGRSTPPWRARDGGGDRGGKGGKVGNPETGGVVFGGPSRHRNDDRLRWRRSRFGRPRPTPARRRRGHQIGLAIAAAGDVGLEPFLAIALSLVGTGVAQFHRICPAVPARRTSKAR